MNGVGQVSQCTRGQQSCQVDNDEHQAAMSWSRYLLERQLQVLQKESFACSLQIAARTVSALPCPLERGILFANLRTTLHSLSGLGSAASVGVLSLIFRVQM